MLYDPERHLQLPKVAWNESEAANFITELFEATESDFLPQHYWDRHPTEENSEPGYRMDLYSGMAGIIWSQKIFENYGYGTIRNSYLESLQPAKANHLKRLKDFINFPNTTEYLSGLFMGELGFLVTECALGLSDELRAELLRFSIGHQTNSICEYMWGTPGSIAVSTFYTNEIPDIVPSVLAATSVLKDQLVFSPSKGINIWQQNLYGFKVCHLGAVHGFSGNAFSIIKTFPFMSEVEKKIWGDQIRETLKSTALRKSGTANWPQSIDGLRPGRDALLLQFCHGAPGMVCCLSGLMGQGDTAFDELMLEAGETTWRAGPLEKGANLCHGTSGNGYAFLKLFKITGDELWLARARQFGMVAIHQSRELKRKHGKHHYSLWEGDTGIGHYLHGCLALDDNIPTMDYF
jgi:hypothetical protein